MARELALAGHLLMDIAVRYQPLGYETACGCGCGQKDAPYETVQIDFWESEADTPAFVGATRSGKTMTGAAKLNRNILKHNTNGLVVGPTWDQTRQIQIDYLLKLSVRDIAHYDRIYQRLIAVVPGLNDVSSTFSMEAMKVTTALPRPS